MEFSTTVQSLPDDIIIEIFSYFNHQDILNVINVCRRWTNIIKTTNSLKCRFKSTVFLRKDALLVNRFYPSEFIDSLTLDMPASCEEIHPEVIELLDRNSGCIKSLTLKTFFMAKAFQVLKMLPKLEKLILINLRRDKTEEMLELPKLKHLELVNALKIGKFITTPESIKTLKVMGVLSVNCKRKRRETKFAETLERETFDEEASTFLGRCVNIKELWISNVQNSSTTLDCSKFLFNLETLVLEYIALPKQNLFDFLVNQKSSLKNFSIMAVEPDKEVMDLVLFNMHLEELEIDTAIIPKDYEVNQNISAIKKLSFKSYKLEGYLRQQEYNKVRHDAIDQRVVFDNKMIDFNFVNNKTRVLKLSDDRDYYITPWNVREWDRPKEGDHPLSSMLIMRILSACPDLEFALFQDFNCPQFLDQLNTSCKNLKELRLYEVPKEITEELKFEDLETLVIDHMKAEDDEEERKRLIDLGSKCPNLKVLKIHDFNEDYTSYFREIAVGIKTLEEIHVGSYYENLDNLLEDIKGAKDEGSNLKHFSCVAYFYETKYFYTNTGMDVYGVKLTFHGLHRKVFTSIYHDRRIGSFRRRMAAKISKMRQMCWNILYGEQTC